MMSTFTAEYVWLDGTTPTPMLRSKTRVLPAVFPDAEDTEDPAKGILAVVESRSVWIPAWGFDGSSTGQAEGGDSDVILRPARAVPDPFRNKGYLVLCETYTADGEPHSSNTRDRLAGLLDEVDVARLNPWIGFEQEYTLFENDHPLGWPKSDLGGYPRPQGPFYCGVGPRQIRGRELVERHLELCQDADLLIAGINAEVMPAQWEFQIGLRGERDHADPMKVCDHLILARWILHRVSEEFGIHVSFDCKPIHGDWNGAGCHTNVSTAPMRDPETGRVAIDAAIDALHLMHETTIREYGEGLAERLTGQHETCSIDTFKAGVADRGASIRIPRPVHVRGHGYIEDRRPGANCDPYRVARALLEAVTKPIEVQDATAV